MRPSPAQTELRPSPAQTECLRTYQIDGTRNRSKKI